MPLHSTLPPELLAAGSRADLAWQARALPRPTSLLNARHLVTRLNELAPPSRHARIAVLRTCTSECLDPWIAYESALQDMACEVYHAPFGFLRQESAPGSGLRAHAADVCLLLLQREDLHPLFQRPIQEQDEAQLASLKQDALNELLSLLAEVRAATPGQLMLGILPRMAGTGLGMFDALSERSEAAWWAGFKADVAQLLRQHIRSAVMLDLDEVASQVGRTDFSDPRFWLTSRVPFAPVAAQEVARRVVACCVLVKQPKAKVIVLDADNTLWGGVVGEDGIDGIALGPDYPGNAFVAFQRRLLDYKQRGFLLAMCSKNNLADVDQVLREHPHQVLKDADFVAKRVNWLPKAQNLESLAEELNLGLDSFIFVDDSEHECLAVRSALPQVEVVRTPVAAHHVPQCLDTVARLEILSLTAEDKAKTLMYAQERQRQELARQMGQTDGQAGDMAAFLAALGMQMDVWIDNPGQVTRLAQLTQKTNQFNLTTRRYTEAQIREFMDSPNATVASFALTDRFGNSGVVGLAILLRDAQGALALDTFLMSCRVIGRRAEHVFIEQALALSSVDEDALVSAEFLPTAKNALAAGFLGEVGFSALSGNQWQRSLRAKPPAPEAESSIKVTIHRPVPA